MGGTTVLRQQFVNWHRSGTTAWQAFVISTACVDRQEQSRKNDWAFAE